MCLKLKIQTKSFTLADNFGGAFFASLASMFFSNRHSRMNTALRHTHTHNTADSPTDTGLLGTRLTPKSFYVATPMISRLLNR